MIERINATDEVKELAQRLDVDFTESALFVSWVDSGREITREDVIRIAKIKNAPNLFDLVDKTEIEEIGGSIETPDPNQGTRKRSDIWL